MASRASIVATPAEFAIVAKSLGAVWEQHRLLECGPVLYSPAKTRPVRPVVCSGYARIGRYELFIDVTSVVRVTGGKQYGGLTQGVAPFPGGSQLFIFADGPAR